MMKYLLTAVIAAVLAAFNFSPAQSAEPLSAENTVGGPNVVSFVEAESEKGATALDLQWDPKSQAGLLAIADVVSYGGPTPVIAAPPGWTLIRDDSSAHSTRQSLYWRVMEGDDPGTQTWTFSEPVDPQGVVVLLDRATAADPIDASSGNTSDTAPDGWHPAASAVTTSSSGDLILAFYATDFVGPMGPGHYCPDDMSLIVDHDVASHPDWILGAYQSGAGDTGDIVCDGVQLATSVGAELAIRR